MSSRLFITIGVVVLSLLVFAFFVVVLAYRGENIDLSAFENGLNAAISLLPDFCAAFVLWVIGKAYKKLEQEFAEAVVEKQHPRSMGVGFQNRLKRTITSTTRASISNNAAVRYRGTWNTFNSSTIQAVQRSSDSRLKDTTATARWRSCISLKTGPIRVSAASLPS